ncbi:MAG: hypothetical protein R3F61_21195 [Myxococcota bacterium]
MQKLELSRRNVLLLGSGAVALLLGVYPAMRQIGCYPAPPEPFEHLGAKSAAIYALLGDFLAPPGGPLPGSGGDLESLRRLDRLLGSVPSTTATLLRALPLAFEHSTALDRYGARSLYHLPPDRQREFLVEWAEADDLIRAQLFMALRSTVGMMYFERPEVVRAMHIAPGCG